ncbi:MAG: DegV family EDD domain-containing protein [Gemmatimonadetes bacterium]|nr:DegV family EDD domain-containing protein [Gemmatimonadota bacterium]
MTVGIAYVDGSRFRRSLLAAADWVAAGRDELNRINVYPVPDGDTGTNLCLTLRAVAQALRDLGDAPLPRVIETMAQASVRGARGNSGMMLSHFLLGFRDGIGNRLRARASHLADGIRQGFDRLQAALDEPVEGTIVTVAREAADEAAAARDEHDIKVFMQRLVRRADAALQRTPELLAVLKAAGVVDAGAKGFVRFLDGVKRLIEEGHIAEGAVDRLAPNAAASTEVAAERDYQYCTEVLVRGDALPTAPEVRKALRGLGGSIVVLQTGDLLKAHVHTDTPEAVFQLGAHWGTVEYTKADDMRAQHAALQEKRAIGFVTDTACDLPDALVFEHGIGLVPTQLILEDKVYKDRLEMTAEEFFTRLRAGYDASTSQPAPQAFTEAFQDATRGADQVLAVILAKALSGTFANAEAAAQAFGGRVTVLNSRSASLGEGLLVLRGQELAARGWLVENIVRELHRVRDQSGAFFTVENFDRLVRSGRVGRGRAWLGTKLNLKPILALSAEGKIEPLDRVRGKPAARRRILELLDEALAGRPRELRLAVVHADIPGFAEQLRAELVARYGPRQCLVSPVTPVIAAHAGIGAWGVFYQVEDGTNR